MALLSLDAGKPMIGNLAAWFLSFHAKEPGSGAPARSAPAVKTFGFNEYNAEISAELASGLSGGSFSFTVEGMTDADYKTAKSAPFVSLYLGWADTNASVGGYLANLVGITGMVAGMAPPPEKLLVAVLFVDKVSRKAGKRRVETTITARDWVYVQTARNWTLKAINADTRDDALKKLLEQTAKLRSSDYELHQSKRNPEASLATPPSPAPKIEFPGETRVTKILEAQAAAIEAETGNYGRGPILFRDGKLHLGIRSIPFDGGEPKSLTVASGFIESEIVVPTDPKPDPDPPATDPPRPLRFKLTLKGRPDIKPGDLVEFDPPAEDVSNTQGGIFGGLTDALLPSLGELSNPKTLYVDSVKHELGRTTGFVTTVTGVEVTRGKEWDPPPPSPKVPAQKTPGASPERNTAEALRDRLRDEVSGRAGTEVAEVRAVTATGSSEPPGQSETLWRGLVPGDGHGYAARRGDIKRPSLSPVSAVPYLTPFAFGKCGLVLPRYPGTRVAVIHRDGKADDPIDAGALWPSGKAPTNAQAGDWWLSLPTEVASNSRSSVQDSETPADYSGKVTQDLIDADGNRVIEVGELTLRVGRNVLRSAGTRTPRGSDQDAITIEHADGGAKLVIKSDGSILIKGTSIELDAGSGEITLKGSAVNVK